MRTPRAGLPRRALDGLLLAATFLTVLPLPIREDHDGTDTAPAWFALVGAAIGLLSGGVLAVAAAAIGSLGGAILAVAALVVLTGGLHQDGLADCADGLGVRGDRERRLAVMRDPAVGSFGTLALVLWALLLTTSLAQFDTERAVEVLVVTAALGRLAGLLHARWAPAARRDGLGASFAPSTAAVILAAASGLVVAFAVDAATAVPAILAALAAAAGVTAGARRALGGRTGDTLGATVVLAELAVVVVLLYLTRH